MHFGMGLHYTIWQNISLFFVAGFGLDGDLLSSVLHNILISTRSQEPVGSLSPAQVSSIWSHTFPDFFGLPCHVLVGKAFCLMQPYVLAFKFCNSQDILRVDSRTFGRTPVGANWINIYINIQSQKQNFAFSLAWVLWFRPGMECLSLPWENVVGWSRFTYNAFLHL